MAISAETRQKMEGFAREQAAYYLEDAEISYLEKLRKKGAKTREKMRAKLDRFHGHTVQSGEAQADLLLLMTDSISDLLAQGMTEEEAFEQSKQRLAADCENTKALSMKDRYLAYIAEKPLWLEEAVGLYYAALLLLGAVLGAIAGFFLGYYLFDAPLYIPIAASAGALSLIGLCAAMLIHASLLRRR